MRNYDLVYVIRPDLEAEAVQATIDRMTARIKEQGGTVEVVDVWGKKRMSYTIRKHRDGVFVHTRFALDTGKLDDIRRTAALSEDVLRATVTTAVGPTPQPKTPAASPPAAATPQAQTPVVSPEPGRGEAPAAANTAAGPEQTRGAEPTPEQTAEAKQ